MEHLLETYVHTYGKRFTRRQKRAFAKQLFEDMKSAGYEGHCDHKRYVFKRVENYVFGSLKTAKRVIVVPYDTPERKFWFQVPYYPFHGTRSNQKGMKATFIPLLIIYAVILLSLWASNFIAHPMIESIVSFLIFIFVLFFIYVMLHGIGNKHNAVRNSSSICSAIALANQLHKDEKRQTVFIFTDQNKGQFLGSKACAQVFEEAHMNPSIILLDCVGAKGDIYIGSVHQYRKIAHDLMQSMKRKKDRVAIVKMNDVMRMQHASQYFKRVVMIGAGSMDEEKEVVVYETGTSKDRVVSMENMKKVVDILYAYIHQS